MKRSLSLAVLAAALGSASAQTAQDIVSRVDAAQKAAKDVSFRLTGTASLDTSSEKIDLTIRTLPAQGLARIQFAAPDALADNVVVADKNEIRQYVFLTNQITVTPLKKAAADAGFGGLDFTQLTNAADLLRSYNVKLLGSTGAAGKRVYQLEAMPKSANDTDRARIWITEAGWRPTRIQMISAAGKTVADLSISGYKTNSGLSAVTLKALPKDAQIIRQ